jgi:mono/diheme cytochrome c family protein
MISVIRALAVASFLTVGVSSQARSADDLIARGEYLARAGDCVACHTDAGGKPFAGGLYMPTPVGSISVPNITADKKTGIGDWTDDQFYRALHEGIGKSGEYLYPVFPFPWYTQVTRDDAIALKAYLFSLPPVDAPRKPLKIGFPFNIREALLTWRTAFFKPHDFQPDPKLNPSQQRGQYLVEGLGHCGECHNARNVLGASRWSGKLEGGVIEGWYAPSLTSDSKQGIGGWSEDDLAKFLKTGAAPGRGVVLGPMQETISESLHYLTDEDLHAIAAYLKSFPADRTASAVPPPVYVNFDAPGAAVYLGNCASCHGLDGTGIAGQIPALKGNGAVLAKGPENIIRVVLGGLPAAHGLAPMPAVGAAISDQDIADVANYVRNAWGNDAPASAQAGDVGALRGQTQTLLAANLADTCGPTQPAVAPLLQGDIATGLRTVNQGDLLQVIDTLLPKVKQAEPALAPEATVNDLTAAYCRILASGPPLTTPEKAVRIGNFSSLVWGQLNGKVAAK